jgi:spoIIIJ-associated protein
MESTVKNPQEVLQEAIKELVDKMGFVCDVVVEEGSEGEEKVFVCNIKVEESNFLIGQYGVNLQSLQHIARVLVRKKIDEKIKFVLDVNSYRQERNTSIVRLAQSMAEQAIQEKRAIVMRPMSPYERRIVHMELSTNSQIKTESIGEGEDRKIIISPLNLV